MTSPWGKEGSDLAPSLPFLFLLFFLPLPSAVLGGGGCKQHTQNRDGARFPTDSPLLSAPPSHLNPPPLPGANKTKSGRFILCECECVSVCERESESERESLPHHVPVKLTPQGGAIGRRSRSRIKHPIASCFLTPAGAPALPSWRPDGLGIPEWRAYSTGPDRRRPAVVSPSLG